jgi:hypothetical protein
MPVKREDLRTGITVKIQPFVATILEVDAIASTIKVQDDAGNISYVYLNRLTKIAPYKAGTVYVSSSGIFYRYGAGTAPGENGTWAEQALTGNDFRDLPGDTPERYGYPGRPLREVTLGEPVTE